METSDSGSDDEDTPPKVVHGTSCDVTVTPENDLPQKSSESGNAGNDLIIKNNYVTTGNDLTPESRGTMQENSDFSPQNSDVMTLPYTGDDDVIPADDFTPGVNDVIPADDVTPADDVNAVENRITLDVGRRDFDFEGQLCKSMDQNKGGLTLEGQINLGGDMTVNKNEYFDHRVKNKVTHHHHGNIHHTVVNKTIVKGSIITQEAGFTQIVDQSRTEVSHDEDVFVETDAYRNGLQLLDTKGILIISGPRGSGKSCMGRALLRHYNTQEYTPLVFHHFQEWRLHVGGDRKLVVLLENIFGKDEVNQNYSHDVLVTVHTMEKFAQSGKCRVVITSNGHVLDTLMGNESSCSNALSRYVFDLCKTNPFTPEEKMDMMQKHLAQAGKATSEADLDRILAIDKSGLYFALRCKQLASMADDDLPDCVDIFMSEAGIGPDTCGIGPKTVLQIAPKMLQYCYEKPDSVSSSQYMHNFDYQPVTSFMQVSHTVPEYTTLHQACRDGDLETVQRLLKGGEDPNVKTSQGVSPLHAACFCGHIPVVEMLLQNQADLRATDAAGWTPLHYACEQGHSDIVQMLISHANRKMRKNQLYLDCTNSHHNLVHKLLACSLNTEKQHGKISVCSACFRRNKKLIDNICSHSDFVNSASDDGVTGLYLAAQNGHPDLVKVLIELGACPQMKHAQSRWTPLHVACYQGHAENAYVLLPFSGGSYAELDKNGYTLLHVASLKGHADIVSALLEDGADAICEDLGNTPLLLACMEGHTDTVSVLLKAKKNAELLKKTPCQAPLDMAVTHGRVELVRMLLEAGLPMQVSERSTTSLHLACCHGHIDIVKTLLQFRAPVDALDASGKTPLGIAVEKKHSEIVDSLCKYGANPNIKFKGRKQYRTPLQAACEKKCVEMVQVLLKNEANTDVKDDLGMTALHIAAEVGSVEIVRMLLDAKCCVNEKDNGSSCRTPLAKAFDNRHWEVFSLLAQHGADVNSRVHFDFGNNTFVHHACKDGNADSLEVLVKCEADLETENDNRQRPIHLACDQSHLKIVQTLLENGASVNASSMDGKGTPLQRACALNKHCKRNWDLPVLLVQYGANVNPDSLPQPLHLACSQGEAEVVKRFLEKGADIEARDDKGFTALHHAVDSGSVDTVEVLLQSKAVVDAQNDQGQTPFLRTCVQCAERFGLSRTPVNAENITDIITIFIRHNASVGVTDRKGRSPVEVFFETYLHNQETADAVLTIVEILIGHLATMNLCTQNGDSALHLAVKIPVSKWYMSGQDRRDWAKPLYTVCKEPLEKQLQFVRKLLSSAEVNAVNAKLQTPLHTAACCSGPDCIKTLMQHGAIVNCQDVDGNTPLHFACWPSAFPCTEAVTELLNSGGNPNIVNKLCYTPLHLICATKEERHVPDRTPCDDLNLRSFILMPYWIKWICCHPAHLYVNMAQILLDHMDAINIISENSLSPLQLAQREGWNTKLIALLIQREEEWRLHSSHCSSEKDSESYRQLLNSTVSDTAEFHQDCSSQVIKEQKNHATNNKLQLMCLDSEAEQSYSGDACVGTLTHLEHFKRDEEDLHSKSAVPLSDIKPSDAVEFSPSKELVADICLGANLKLILSDKEPCQSRGPFSVLKATHASLAEHPQVSGMFQKVISTTAASAGAEAGCIRVNKCLDTDIGRSGPAQLCAGPLRPTSAPRLCMGPLRPTLA